MDLVVTIAAGALLLATMLVVGRRVSRLGRRIELLPRADDVRQLAVAAATDARLQPLEDGLRKLGDQIARLPAPLEAKDLVPLQERVEQLARAIAELRHHVDELRLHQPGVASDAGADGRLLRALEQRGFDSIRILAELSDEEAGEPVRVPVEARRAGMSYKGFVVLEEGRLRDVALKPVTEVFP